MVDVFGAAQLLSNPPPWPHGFRCAVAITFDVDTDSMLHSTNPQAAHTQMTALSWTRYDEVAIPRILAMFRHYGLTQTFFLPGWCIERYPKLVTQIAEAGHEVALHGYIHELSNQLTRSEEETRLERAVGAYEHLLGQRPAGWRAPYYSFSNHSADLLAAAGFSYDSSLMGDDVPYILRSGSGDLLEIPADFQSDDWPQYVQSPEFDYMMPIRAPQRAIEVFRAEFETAYGSSGLWVSVWHPFVSGRPSRIVEASKLLADAQGRGDVWIAPLRDIASHVRAQIDAGHYHPRIHAVPFYAEPVPILPHSEAG